MRPLAPLRSSSKVHRSELRTSPLVCNLWHHPLIPSQSPLCVPKPQRMQKSASTNTRPTKALWQDHPSRDSHFDILIKDPAHLQIPTLHLIPLEHLRIPSRSISTYDNDTYGLTACYPPFFTPYICLSSLFLFHIYAHYAYIIPMYAL